MKRTGRVKARRAEPRRRDSPQESAGWWEAATMLLLARSGSRCEKCGGDLLGVGLERHHRQRRRDGGDRISNLLALHPACHKWITEHPEESKVNGWIVPAWVADPALVPVQLPGGGLWVLGDDGTKARWVA